MFEIYLISTVIVFVLSIGMFYAYSQGKYATIAEEDRVFDVVCSIFAGIICGFFSVIGLIMILLFTNFAKYGWKFPLPKLKIEELDQ